MQTARIKNKNHRAKSTYARVAGYQNFSFYSVLFNFEKRGGFGLIETVVGAAIIGLVLVGLTQVGQFTFRVVGESNVKLRAAFMAEEGLEAVRLIRDAGWSNVTAFSVCTPYYPVWSGGAWQLEAGETTAEDTTFTRVVRFEAVSRDGNDDITSAHCTLGAGDPDIRKVTVDVFWMQRGMTASTSVSTYFANLFGG